MDLVRSLVSKKKRRWEADGFNLDLTYITDAIIAMGFPSEGTEGLFRNPLSEVQRFLKERHGEHFHVYNLCIERSYKPEKFAGRVSVFPFADHNAPPLPMIREFCVHVDAFLKADVKNIAAIHCKAGKGRTGTFICCYLLYCGAMKTAADVLEFYGVRRTYNGHGVTIPSQRRYVGYFAETVQPSWDSARERMLWSLRRIYISHVPKHDSGDAMHGEWKPLIGVTRKDKTLLYVGQDDASDATVPSFHCDGLVVQGDLKFELFNGKSTKRILWLWLNTAFIPPGHCVITLKKHEIDGICKDKEHKIVPQDFHISIFFERVLGRSRTHKGSKAPPPNQAILDLKPALSTSPTGTSPNSIAIQATRTPPSISISGASLPKSTPAHELSSVSSNTQGTYKPQAMDVGGNAAASAPGNANFGAALKSEISIDSVPLQSPDFASLHGGMSESMSTSPYRPQNSTSPSNSEAEKAKDANSALVCNVCNQPIVNGTDSVQSQGRNIHWACATCAVCSEPLANRGSCTIADTTTIHGALICSNCDTFWERCPHCKRPLQDGATLTEVPTLGKRCNACFCCSICQLQFASGEDDEDDDETDAYDIVMGSLICRSHSASSRKIYSDKTTSFRPRSARFGGAEGIATMPSSAPIPSSPSPSVSESPLHQTTLRVETTLRGNRPKAEKETQFNKLSLRRLKGIAVEMPRCGLCHGLIDVNCESVFVEQWRKSFHQDHFKCASCNTPILSGELYHIVEEAAHCNDCYSKSSSCHKCHLPLLGSAGIVQAGPELLLHPACFTCDCCHTPIKGSFFEISSQTVCMSCFNEQKYKSSSSSEQNASSDTKPE